MFNFIRKDRKRDHQSILSEMKRKDFAEFGGELEVIEKNKFGIIENYEKGDNTVTLWSKHATMHLLTGESFSYHGTQRSFDETADHTSTTNTDGTLLSGQQYFSDNTTPDFSIEDRWSKSTFTPIFDVDGITDPADIKHPFFPTKMLFGTGFEFTNWANLSDSFRTFYESLGWNQTTFDSNISNGSNNYSAIWSASALNKARTVNDISSSRIDLIPDSDDFAISGAIKHGLFEDNASSATYLEAGEENEILKRTYSGIGKPCFIYANRTARFFEEGSEILLTADSNIENKVTYTTVMPEQTGDNSGIFYPYNNYMLKVAGLFTDARLILGNDETSNTELYNKMPYGLMYSKRYINPTTKSHDNSLTFRWTIYL
jgi:hypothetical protein